MKLVILDRDGVINHDSASYIKSPDEWKPIPGSLEAIALLNQAGYRVLIATNQSGVGRGLFDMATLNAIHDKMHRALGQFGGHVDGIFYCPHAQEVILTVPASFDAVARELSMTPEDVRRINMFSAPDLPAIGTVGVSLNGIPFIGDSLRDLQAAAAVEAQPVLVLTGKGKKTRKDGDLPEGTVVHADLAEAVHSLLQ